MELFNLTAKPYPSPLSFAASIFKVASIRGSEDEQKNKRRASYLKSKLLSAKFKSVADDSYDTANSSMNLGGPN